MVWVEQVFPCNAIWIPKASMKMCVPAWLAARGAILTTNNVEKAEGCMHQLVLHVQGNGQRCAFSLTLLFNNEIIGGYC